MNTDQATNPGSTGPRTEQGKAKSSRNSLKHGLFAAHDAIREGEREEYDQARAALIEQLAPEGLLEEAFVAEIMSATWRLRRCRLHEESFVNYIRAGLLSDDYLTPAPQQTVDRARAHAGNSLRRSIAELRKLQTERAIRTQLHDLEFPALADSKQVLNAVKAQGKQSPTEGSSFLSSPNPQPQWLRRIRQRMVRFVKLPRQPPTDRKPRPEMQPVPAAPAQNTNAVAEKTRRPC